VGLRRAKCGPFDHLPYTLLTEIKNKLNICTLIICEVQFHHRKIYRYSIDWLLQVLTKILDGTIRNMTCIPFILSNISNDIFSGAMHKQARVFTKDQE